jgi:hypothetical protein
VAAVCAIELSCQNEISAALRDLPPNTDSAAVAIPLSARTDRHDDPRRRAIVDRGWNGHRHAAEFNVVVGHTPLPAVTVAETAAATIPNQYQV